MAYSLSLGLKIFFWVCYNCIKRHFTQYKSYAKQDEINLSCIETEDDKVIKFFITLTLHGQLFGSPLAVLSPAKIFFIAYYRDFLAMLNLFLTLE